MLVREVSSRQKEEAKFAGVEFFHIGPSVLCHQRPSQ